MTRPLWKELLDHPTQAFDPESAGLTLIAGGGDAARHYAVRRWLGVRGSDAEDMQAAIAVILAEAFGDRRALDVLADSSPVPYPDQLSRFDGNLGPSSLVAEVFGPRILDGLRAYLEDEGDLPFDLLAAAGRFRLDDEGEIYLPIRAVAVVRTSGTPSSHLGMSFADRALEVAAFATPDRFQVQRTVLASWGLNLPIGAVPIEDARAGFAPTRWIATCHLIAGTSSWRIADRLIELAMADEYWRTPTTDARAFVDALETSRGDGAAAALQTIVDAEVSVSNAALAAIERRQSGIEAGASAALRAIGETAQGLLGAGLIDAMPSTESVTAMIPQVVVRAGSSSLDFAQQLLVSTGRAASVCLFGEFEPPLADALGVAAQLAEQSIGFDNVFVEPAGDSDLWLWRFTRAGEPITRQFEATYNILPQGLLEAVLAEASAQVSSEEGRQLVVLSEDCLDAVIGYVDPVAWARFAADEANAARPRTRGDDR